MNTPGRVGVVGCGVISRVYAESAKAFDSFDLVACADLDESQALALAEEHDLKVVSVDELIDDPSIDVVLNLTPPAAHATVIGASLAAGKHVYTEKPLAADTAAAAALVAEAGRLGLRVGCAPDTFLSSAYQAGRTLLDAGAIGEPLSVSAAVLVGGQESWHPNPDIFFADGAGPLLDMGPYYLTAIVSLLGPVARVAGFASTRTRERTIEIGPRAGERFTVATPSHATAVMELQTARPPTSSRASRRTASTSAISRSTAPTGCSPSRTRTASTVPFACGKDERAGRTCRSSAAEPETREASGCTSSSRRSPPAGRSAPREASACTSSTWPGASSSQRQSTGSWRSARARLSPTRCRSRRLPDYALQPRE